jgi:hypothetical protein
MKNKIFKQNEDMSVTDISNKILIQRILLISVCVLYFFSSFRNEVKFVDREIGNSRIDTIKELVVLKSGLTEITVDRNKNIPTFCNNPGNLRPSSIKEVNDLAIGVIQAPSGEFLYFANAEHGFKALEIVLRRVYWDKTLKETISRYCPTSEQVINDYVDKICSKLKCTSQTKVKDLNLKELMNRIAEIEGFKTKL